MAHNYSKKGEREGGQADEDGRHVLHTHTHTHLVKCGGWRGRRGASRSSASPSVPVPATATAAAAASDGKDVVMLGEGEEGSSSPPFFFRGEENRDGNRGMSPCQVYVCVCMCIAR